MIGDSVKFTSLCPHKIAITGRTQLFINAFGEELMISNTEKALAESCKICNCSVENYTVAPLFMKGGSKGSHQWLIEFKSAPLDEDQFIDVLDKAVCKVNSDYEAKRTNNVTMTRLSLVCLPEGTFYKWLSDKGKLAGQNKVPRLSNSRAIADELLEYKNQV